jgi:hypothetical protein
VKLSQVLTNLIGNAIKFTERGSVTVAAEAREITETAIAIEFSVTDTGIGIPAEKQAHIFEEFVQASYAINETYGGTGLGLAISRKLVELHGGKLALTSEPGKGSRFFFTLSLKPGPEPAAGPLREGHDGTGTSLAGLRVLVAEDNRVNRFILASSCKNGEPASTRPKTGPRPCPDRTKRLPRGAPGFADARPEWF